MTESDAKTYVIDTGPLSHLAKAGWLSIVRTIAKPGSVVIPDAVERELRRGVHKWPHLRLVLDAHWIDRAVLDSDAEIQANAHFSGLLVSGTRNLGEAAVLAYAKVHDAVAVVDDGAACRAADQAGVVKARTLKLLCDAVREGLLTKVLISEVADHLNETEYHLPFERGGLVEWAEEHGLLG